MIHRREGNWRWLPIRILAGVQLLFKQIRQTIQTLFVFFRHPDRLNLFEAARLRLVWTNLAVVLAILATVAVAVYTTEVHAIDTETNQQLSEHLDHSAQHMLLEEYATITNGIPTDAHDHLPYPGDYYRPTSTNVFYRLYDASGTLLFDPSNVTTYDSIPSQTIATQLKSAKGPYFSESGHDDMRFRLLTTPIIDANGTVVGAMQAGISIEPAELQLHDLIKTLLLVSLGAVILTIAGGIFLAERALVPIREAYSRQRQFVAAASHELRTPLAFVRSQSDLIARHIRRLPAAEQEIFTEDVQDIQGEVDYMTELVRDLLLLARGEEAGTIPTGPVDLQGVITPLVERMQDQASKAGLALLLVKPSSPLTVQGDANRLRQLFTILLDNALHYTSEGGTVRVNTTVNGTKSVTVAISDTGPGIAKEHQLRIFEPFYRVDPARKRSDGHVSAGLGLALARQIVQTMNGTLTVTSQVGQGSTFSVTLPLQ